jgi:RNA polymerase sigma-70 factor (ECF subfamily)
MSPEASEHANDAALVARARLGDRIAFGALYQRHARMVQAVLLSRMAPDGVDDLLHDVFLKAMNHLHALRDDEAFPGWLATMARRHAADWRRRRRDTVELDDQMQAPEVRDSREAIELIRALPEAYRETLLLRFVAGLNGPEIAERTGLTPGSVRVNLHRGVTLLRERLGKEPDHA